MRREKILDVLAVVTMLILVMSLVPYSVVNAGEYKIIDSVD